MIIQIVSLFLVVIVALALFGKLRMPGRLRGPDRRAGLKKPGKCRHCGKFLIGGGRCDCGRG